jgi:type IV secretory pathway VirB10-like protein
VDHPLFLRELLRPSGRTVARITSIATRRLSSGQTISFSIHQVAERERVPFAEIEQHYDRLERQMLDEFYEHVGAHRGMDYLHWNMRDINYGFAALEQRHRVLGGTPVVIDEERKFDLSRLFIDIYGVSYIGHAPRSRRRQALRALAALRLVARVRHPGTGRLPPCRCRCRPGRRVERRSCHLFRLQLKPAPKETKTADVRVDPKAAPVETDGGLATLSALRAAERALALAGGDADVIGASINVGDQTRKLTFLKAGPEKEIYNQHGLQTPVSAYQLMAGTVIAASLITGLNSDLPGFVIAQVTEHVYDTVTGRFLLIPQGSRLIGKYDNIVAFGQERALVVWQRIILPDGSSIVIDNLPATDTGGYAGLADEVDLHKWKLLKGVALATVLGVGSELAFGSGDSDLVKALQQTTQATTNRAGQRLIERNLNVQPTITVRPGWPLRVIVHRDLLFRRPYRGTASK